MPFVKNTIIAESTTLNKISKNSIYFKIRTKYYQGLLPLPTVSIPLLIRYLLIIPKACEIIATGSEKFFVQHICFNEFSKTSNDCPYEHNKHVPRSSCP